MKKERKKFHFSEEDIAYGVMLVSIIIGFILAYKTGHYDGRMQEIFNSNK